MRKTLHVNHGRSAEACDEIDRKFLAVRRTMVLGDITHSPEMNRARNGDLVGLITPDRRSCAKLPASPSKGPYSSNPFELADQSSPDGASHTSTSLSPKKSRKARKRNLENEEPLSGAGSLAVNSDLPFGPEEEPKISPGPACEPKPEKVPRVIIATAFEYGNDECEVQEPSPENSVPRPFSISPEKLEMFATMEPTEMLNAFMTHRSGQLSVVPEACPSQEKSGRSFGLTARMPGTQLQEEPLEPLADLVNVQPFSSQSPASAMEEVVLPQEECTDFLAGRVTASLVEDIAKLLQEEARRVTAEEDTDDGLLQLAEVEEEGEEDLARLWRQTTELQATASTQRQRPDIMIDEASPEVRPQAASPGEPQTEPQRAGNSALESYEAGRGPSAPITFQELQHRAFLLHQQELDLQHCTNAMILPQVPQIASTESAMSMRTS